jgi:hypothetical protein
MEFNILWDSIFFSGKFWEKCEIEYVTVEEANFYRVKNVQIPAFCKIL